MKNLEQLKDALKEYFAPKKSYSQYCAEIQAIRMCRNETILEYYARIDELKECASAALSDKFSEAELTEYTLKKDTLKDAVHVARQLEIGMWRKMAAGIEITRVVGDLAEFVKRH